jgi:hypothetical protein
VFHDPQYPVTLTLSSLPHLSLSSTTKARQLEEMVNIMIEQILDKATADFHLGSDLDHILQDKVAEILKETMQE